jgi:intein/homing endonuclease
LIPQEFSNPSPNNTTTVTVTGVDSGISAIVSITVNSTQGSSYDSSGPSCFIEGTEIQMANGMKFIEDITVGDMVKSFDLKSNTIMNSKVMETFIHTPHNYMIINGIIKTTDNHPFYSDGNWIEAGDLSIGDKILHVDGLEHTIKTIELSDESVTVYNFEVDGTHNYFAEGYLVHNKQTSGTQRGTQQS